MTREQAVTSLVRQATYGGPVSKALLESAMAKAEALCIEEAANIRRVILTGCGDSWCAAIAMKPMFEELLGIRVDAPRCIEVSRYFAPEDFKDALVVGISCSGAVSRVAEAMKRAAALGATTLAVTFNADSAVGSSCKYALCPEFPHHVGKLESPGSLSYNSSLMGLMSLAIKLASDRGVLCADGKKAIVEGFNAYADAAQAALDTFHDKAFALAEAWKDYTLFDFIGDYGDYATAFMGSAKVLEATGGHTTYDDSEDWCHINFFLRNPQDIVRVMVANEGCPSISRLRETAATIAAIRSPLMVVGDCDASLFPEAANVFTLPKADKSWYAPAMQHFVYDLVIGYIAGLTGIAAFRRDDDPESVFANDFVRDVHRIRESEIIVLS